MHEVRTKNANGRRRRKVVRERAMKLLDIVREAPGERLGFYNKALGVPNGYRETAERCLIEDGLVEKSGLRRGARLFPVDYAIEPDDEITQAIKDVKLSIGKPPSDFNKAEPLVRVAAPVMFSGFPRLLSERCHKLEEHIFYLVAAIEDYMDGDISGKEMRAVIKALEERV